MNRWRVRLAELQGKGREHSLEPVRVVRNVQIVQKRLTEPTFEHSEQNEHRSQPQLRPSPPIDEACIEAERAAIIEHGAGVPRYWAEAFARLDLSRPPKGYTRERWQQVVDDGGRLLDNRELLAEALRLGWRAEHLFGVHRREPISRFDAMGLVALINGGEVTDIKVDRATISSTTGGSLTFYLRRDCEEAVPLWELDEHD